MASESVPATRPLTTWESYRLRWKRRRMLWRSFRSRHQLTSVTDRTDQIGANDVLAVTVVRNEMQRLPFFLSYYRDLGVSHFLMVDNASDDGSAGMLAEQPDVSLWRTDQSYHSSRFGLDWLTWLQMKYAHDHWCLMVDADEILIYAHHEQRSLLDLTAWLDEQGRAAFGAHILDLFPKGRIGAQSYSIGQDPTEVLAWFDTGPYRTKRQFPMGNLWVQGGIRERVFFPDEPQRSPTLNKLPLVRWNRRFAYVNSCHSILPRELNRAYDGPGSADPSGVLLHSKFLPEIVTKSAIEKDRKQHFHKPKDFESYYDYLSSDPDLWHEGAQRLTGWQQLQKLGLMNSGGW